MNSLKRSPVFVPRLLRTAAIGNDPKAGAIVEEGGIFGKLEIAREAEYFYKKQLQQLSELRHQKEVSSEEFLKKQIKEHEEALIRCKENLAKLHKEQQ